MSRCPFANVVIAVVGTARRDNTVS